MVDLNDYGDEEIIIDNEKVDNSNLNKKIMRSHRRMGDILAENVFYCKENLNFLTNFLTK